MPLLSIHLITYNNERHIEKTLQSILKQEIDVPYEIVVGDDRSTDHTFEIINRYALKHPDLFNILQNPQQLGILENFKTTLDRCRGTYVFDIAGDDFIENPDALQKMVSIFKENPQLGFVDCGYHRFDEKTNITTPFINSVLMNASKEAYKKAVLLGKVIPIGHCFNKALLYKYVDFDAYLKMKLSIEDYPILVDMVMNSDFELIKEPLLVYRTHDGSHSHKKDLEFQVAEKKQMKGLFEHFSVKYNFPEELKNHFKKSYLKELLFLAGYFQSAPLGKDVFSQMHTKSFRDHIHFFASQSATFRKLISLKSSLFK